MAKKVMMDEDKRHTLLVGKRKHYKQPSLREYGSVKDLTAGGGTDANEGGGTFRTTGP